MFCPNCGNEIRDGAKFCAYCGAVVPDVETAVLMNEHDQDQIVSQAHEQDQNIPTFQEQSQNQNQPAEQELYQDNNLPESSTPYQTPNQMSPKRSNKTAIAIIAVIVVLALIIGSVLLVFRRKGNDDSDGYDAEYTLNTYCVFSSRNIKDGKECEISIDSDDGDEIGKSYHVVFKLTEEKPNVQLNLVEAVYIVSISYENSNAKHQLTTDKSCEKNLMTFDVENIKAEPELTPDGESLILDNNIEIYRPVLEEMQRIKNTISYDDLTNHDGDGDIDSFLKNLGVKYVDGEMLTSLTSGSDSLYSFADIDKDGTAELIVGEKVTIDDTSKRELINIIAIFSEQDGKINRLLSSYFMTSVSIYNNGTILISESSGMAIDNTWRFYRIAENKMGLKEICRLHYNGEAGDKYIKNDTTEISRSDFDSIFREYVGATVDFGNFFALSSDEMLSLSWNKLDDNSAAATLKQEEKTSAKGETTATTTTTKPQTQSITESIRKEYKKILSQYSENIGSSDYPYYHTYTVYDIDKNGTPELIIRDGNCEANYVFKVYTYTTNAVYIGESNGGHIALYAIDKQDGIYAHFGHMGMESLDRIYIKGGTLLKEEIRPMRSFEDGNQEYIYVDENNYLKEIDVIDYSYIDNIK